MAGRLTPQVFVMHGARAAFDGGLTHIERHIVAIEKAVYDEPHLAFDLAKNMIESVCKSILTERAVKFEGKDDMPRLLKAATQCLPFLPVGGDAIAPDGTDVRASLEKTLSGLNQTLLGVCELRNGLGLVSHGKSGPVPEMASVQALLVAQAADAMIGFLYRIHTQDALTRPTAVLRYDDPKHAPFNAAVDEANDTVKIGLGAGVDRYELEYDPSRVLFDVDSDAYKTALDAFGTETPTAEAAITTEAPSEQR
jgi:hypothetical protein